MSGNALTGKCEIKRIENANTLDALATKIMKKISNTSAIPIYHAMRQTLVLRAPNMSYGDLDFVVSQTAIDRGKVTPEKVAELLGSKAWAENGRVWSFEFEGYQVDFIRVDQETVNLNATLLGHGGGGLLVKYLLRSFGFKLNENGVSEVLRDGAQKYEEISVCKDLYQVISLVGLESIHGFMYGFTKIDALYSEILSSSMFTLSSFDFDENFDYVGKPSRLEYPPFAGFVDYVKREGPRRTAVALRLPVKPTEAQIKRLDAKLKHYPTYLQNRKFAQEEYAQTKLLRSKFSGEIAMQATGLEPGNDLGLFMEAFKASFPNRGKFEFYLLTSTPETIQDGLKAFYARYKSPESLAA